MGFRALTGRSKNAEMLVSVSLAKPDQDAAVAAAKAGAAFLLLDQGDLELDADAIRAVTGTVEIPCGLRLDSPMAGASGVARGLGLDYLQLEDRGTPATVLLDEEMGFILSIAENETDTFLRLLEAMPFEALFAGDVSQPFTFRRQLELRRLSGLARKPLIVHAQDSLTSEDLECLRDSGVAAVLIDAEARSGRRFSALRQAIEAMRPRRRRRGERDSAVLPSVAHGADDSDDEED
jgi:hypothetical protein